MKLDITQFQDSFVQQWGPVVNQFSDDRTMKENLLAYQYPDDLPNLTRDISNEVVIDRAHMRVLDKGSDPGASRLVWAIPQPDGVYYFNVRLAVCPDNTVLCFD